MPAHARRAHPQTAAEIVAIHEPPTPVLAAATKPARTRYLRLFPERLLYLLDRLTEREFVAYCRLASEFVQLDGALPAADARMAVVVKLRPKAWGELRDKLLLLGLGRIEHGHWIDDDQLRNLELQRRASEQRTAAVQARWNKQRAGREA